MPDKERGEGRALSRGDGRADPSQTRPDPRLAFPRSGKDVEEIAGATEVTHEVGSRVSPERARGFERMAATALLFSEGGRSLAAAEPSV